MTNPLVRSHPLRLTPPPFLTLSSPQDQNGDDFPAKNYGTSAIISAITPVATLVAGEDYTWDLKGTATHNGGSCQVGISYDVSSAVVYSFPHGADTAIASSIWRRWRSWLAGSAGVLSIREHSPLRFSPQSFAHLCNFFSFPQSLYVHRSRYPGLHVLLVLVGLVERDGASSLFSFASARPTDRLPPLRATARCTRTRPSSL